MSINARLTKIEDKISIKLVDRSRYKPIVITEDRDQSFPPPILGGLSGTIKPYLIQKELTSKI